MKHVYLKVLRLGGVTLCLLTGLTACFGNSASAPLTSTPPNNLTLPNNSGNGSSSSTDSSAASSASGGSTGGVGGVSSNVAGSLSAAGTLSAAASNSSAGSVAAGNVGCIGGVCNAPQTQFVSAPNSNGLGIIYIYDKNSPGEATVFGVGVNNPNVPTPANLLNLTENGNMNLGGALKVDNQNQNNGSGPSLSFGATPNAGGFPSGQGIGSNVSGQGANVGGLDFYIKNRPAMSITSSSLIGINTTAPAATLEVNGTEQVDSNLTVSGQTTLGGLTVQNAATFQGTTQVSGGLNLAGGISNVPSNCSQQSAKNTNQVLCGAGEIVLSGGVSCPSGSYATSSAPVAPQSASSSSSGSSSGSTTNTHLYESDINNGSTLSHGGLGGSGGSGGSGGAGGSATVQSEPYWGWSANCNGGVPVTVYALCCQGALQQ